MERRDQFDDPRARSVAASVRRREMALQDEVERQRGGLEPASNEASGVLAQRDDCVARPWIMVI
jgi:hypothetical protein